MSMYGRGTRRPVVICGPGRTKQSEAEACDINLIMSSYRRTGFVTHVRSGIPTFADVSAVPDYRTAVDNLLAANEYFLTLPAKVRGTFDHDPAAFIDFLADPATDEEKLAERGLIVLPAAPVVPPAAAAAPAAPPPAPPSP